MSEAYWKIWIDTGGTFTDCVALDPEGNKYRQKVLSKAALRGRIYERVNGPVYKADINWGTDKDIFNGYIFNLLDKKHRTIRLHQTNISQGILILDQELDQPLKEPLDFEISSGEEAPILAARIVTGTPLQKRLPPLQMRLGSTIGTNALLERKGARTFLFVSRGFKDMLLIGNQQRPHIFSLHIPDKAVLYERVAEFSERISNDGKVLVHPEEQIINDWIKVLHEEGIESVAVSFLNSYRHPAHEKVLCAKLRRAGLKHVTGSFDVAPVIGYLNRTETAVVNAYLDPVVRRYLENVSGHISGSYLKVMTSAGGLVDYDNFLPKDSLFSGPAGGVVGAVGAAQLSKMKQIISFDMGGTSTDVARYDRRYEYQYETTVGGATIVSPSLSIETVASGGGSICMYDGIKFSVGPESAGAQPGPACYGAGGPLTITDVNLLLGRLDESNFGIPLTKAFSELAFQKLLRDHPVQEDKAEHILEGFLRIVNENMATAIRKISVNKGYDPTEYSLVSFGGAGGQHACDVAEILSIKNILIPYDAGVLSAVGMGHARIERFSIQQILEPYEFFQTNLQKIVQKVSEEAIGKLLDEDIAEEDVYVREVLLYLRFLGQETTLEVNYTKNMNIPDAFRKKYEKTYGHWIRNREIEVESLKVIAAEKQREHQEHEEEITSYAPAADGEHKCWMDGRWISVPVYRWEKLKAGASVRGPALVNTEFSTILIKTGWEFLLDQHNHALVRYESSGTATSSISGEEQHFDDSIQIELFTNRFISLAEEMGALLRRSSFSVNIKERLDYSCALLDAKGELIVNAPHIPVHLGGLGLCVRSIMDNFDIKPGQVYITNHPGFGGSHLPDITLAAPVFDEKDTLLGFVANRAHHAELGGKRPGSMPPDARNLLEEGKVISPFCLVEDGKANWEKIEELLSGSPWPTRSLEENLADLTGALASIRTGHDNLLALCHDFGSQTIMHYMEYLKEYANSVLMRNLKKMKKREWSAREQMDDGHQINVNIILSQKGLEFDFSGSSSIHPGNLNATPAIVRSAVLYVLRLLCDEDIPLNEGLMRSVQIRLPVGFLNPDFPKDLSRCPAVVGGNTETSQRLVDTLLKAFRLSACSQGTMNNFLFGNGQFSYYETIGGGVGAVEGFQGASGVHQHMTNTRITDPEVLEFRYPVRLDHFGIRENSGGNGHWRGGNGIVRSLTFLQPLEITLLTQHRQQAPFGMSGGDEGRTGEQYITRSDGRIERLRGIDACDVLPGDSITILTPGGGGWGPSAKG